MLNLCSDFINRIHLEVVDLFAFLSLGVIFKPGEDIKPKKGVCLGGPEAVPGGAVPAVPPAAVTLQLGMSCPHGPPLLQSLVTKQELAGLKHFETNQALAPFGSVCVS